MHTPLVSVIITTYNRFNLLCRAIESVLNQSHNNIEIIVVDDCSSDGTNEKIKKYLDSVFYIRNSENIGLAASRNVGINSSTGEYISFLDDDDELLPFKIEKQINIFTSNKKVDVVYCGSIKKFDNLVINHFPKFRGKIFPQVLHATPNAVHTLLIKKSCLMKVGLFDEKFKSFEDFDLWIRLSKECYFDFIGECLVIYHIHGDQMTTVSEKIINSANLLLYKHKDLFEKHNKYLYLHLRRQASRYAISSDYPSFYKYIFLSIRTSPFSPGSYIHLLVSIVSRRLHKKLIKTFGIKEINGILRY